MKLKSITGSLLAVGALLVATPASADLTFYGDFTNIAPPPGEVLYDATDDRGALDCTSTCEGLLSNLASDTDPALPNYDQSDLNAGTANGFSGTDADLFWLPNSGEDTEETFVETVLNLAPGTLDATQAIAGDGDLLCTSSEYILFKIGQEPQYALVHNTSGGEQCFTYTGFTGEGGLSHITTFGGTTSVSEPNVLALFGLSLLMLGFLRRKTNA